jgi:hypothetical protein
MVNLDGFHVITLLKLIRIEIGNLKLKLYLLQITLLSLKKLFLLLNKLSQCFIFC